MGEDIKTVKSEEFAVRIVETYRFLTTSKSEYVMSKQLLRAGTSIGANVAEANYSESEADFVHKLTVAQKEASETRYWLSLLLRSGYLEIEQVSPLVDECDSLLRILTSIIRTIKSRIKTQPSTLNS